MRERSGKKTGGQKGHCGKTLSRTGTPDATLGHCPEACGRCGAALSAAMATDHAARQVFDLTEPQPLIVTEHRVFACRCPACGEHMRAAFPEGVAAAAQHGGRVAAVVASLLHLQFLPEKRLAQMTADLFGVRLTTATIARMSQSCTARLGGFAATVRGHVAAAPVEHLDETGFRIGGKTQWLHIASTLLLTSCRMSPRRGSLPEGVTGIVVHDHWKPYYTLEGVLHALCNAHHLRELKALVESEREDWARKMQTLLRRACHATNLACEPAKPLSLRLTALIGRCYDAILAQGLAFHDAQPALRCASGKAKEHGWTPRRVGHNLLLRLSTRKPDVLRFLSDPTIPFPNTLAKRDARMMTLRQKNSDGSCSAQGAEDFGTIRSVLPTARKQGWTILQTLSANPNGLIANCA